MRPIFKSLTLRMTAKRYLSHSQARALLMAMSEYQDARQSGAALPTMPKVLNRKRYAVLVWALFRTSYENPFGMAGLLCIPPGLIVVIFHYAERAAKALGLFTSTGA